MAIFQDIVTYFFLFVTMYVEIFILTMLYSRQREIKKEKLETCANLKNYPTVTIIVPCYNEEKTVGKTLDSLINLDYPKDKLSVIAVNDGSSDATWNIIQSYAAKYPSIQAINKPNGGKFTALNAAIEASQSEFIGCLDADSFVDSMTLKKIMKRFEEEPETMAVTPAIRIFNPSSVVQLVQRTEYYLAILAKKVQSFLGAIHVTPGPFTIFRREVFERIGTFKKAHNLEDMEMAFRMQKNHMKIGNVHHAWVYTVGPNTLAKLYKQRVRWTHGFLENARDYKSMFLNPRYGNVSLLTLPTALLFIIAVVFTLFFIAWRTVRFLFRKIIQWKTVGFLLPHFTFSWFYVSAKLSIILSAVVLCLSIFLLLNAQKLVEGSMKPGRHIFAYLILYPLISPLWVLKSIWNTIFSRTESWR